MQNLWWRSCQSTPRLVLTTNATAAGPWFRPIVLAQCTCYPLCALLNCYCCFWRYAGLMHYTCRPRHQLSSVCHARTPFICHVHGSHTHIWRTHHGHSSRGACCCWYKHIQGVPKKMQHSNFPLRSVLEVQFNFFTCVSESEFWARSIWAHYR